MRKLVCVLCSFLAMTQAMAALGVADAASVEPVGGAALDKQFHPIPQARTAQYLAHVTRPLTFYDFEGRNEALKSLAAQDVHKPMRVGEGLALDMAGKDWLEPPFFDGMHYVFLGAVTSADAQAIRLRLDLSSLADDEEAWVIDPIYQRPFGPYFREDHIEGGRWLPTIEGDTAVVMVRSLRETTPLLTLTGLSHFFWSFAEMKLLSCNVNIACETDSDLQGYATAVGIMVVPFYNDSALCSGTLVNNPDTDTLEPYFLTSNHCVPDSYSASQIDVVWDFRAPTCGGEFASAWAALPRSRGVRTLATSSVLDITLLRLDAVPSGLYGRTYLGYDTNTPVVGENVVAMHFPQGSHMRISYGNVIGVNLTSLGLGYTGQTEVRWSVGVTEAGSSGSALLLAQRGYRISGTLSNGPSHSCGLDRSGNTDRFSAFRFFFTNTSAGQYLAGANPPTGGGTITCPAEKVLEDHPEVLDHLRQLRDRSLLAHPVGRQAVSVYYWMAPTLCDLLDKSPAFKGMVQSASRPLWGWFDSQE